MTVEGKAFLTQTLFYKFETNDGEEEDEEDEKEEAQGEKKG